MRFEQFEPFGRYTRAVKTLDPSCRLAPNQWIGLSAVARLLGMDHALVFKRAITGKYGPITRGTSGQVFVSLAGLENAARWTWTVAQLEAADAGLPLPPGDPVDGRYHRPRRKPSVDEVAARLNAEAASLPSPPPAPALRSDDEVLPNFPDTSKDLEN